MTGRVGTWPPSSGTGRANEGPGSRRGPVAVLVVLLACRLFLANGDVRAGDKAGPIIREIKVAGNTTIREDAVLSKLLVRVGRPFDQGTLDADLRALYRTKWFSDVRVEKQAVDSDGVILTFSVIEMPVLTAVEFRGRRNLKLKDLEDNTGLKVGERADSVKNLNAVGQVKRLYAEKGYDHAEVVLLEGGKPGDRRVILQIFEGPKTRVGAIKFTGNTIVSDAVLNTKITTRTELFNWFRTRPPRETIDEDVRKLMEYYQSLGYFDAEVSASTRSMNDPGQIEVEYVITERIQYKVRNIRFEGNEKLSNEQLLQGMQLLGGKPYGDLLRSADAKTLQQKYTALGCIDVSITPEPKFTDEDGVVDLIYKIDEGQSYTVGAIKVHGNGRTQDKVVRRELLMSGLAPGEPLDATKLEMARKRLTNLQYFANQPDQNKAIKIQIVNRRSADQKFPAVAAPDLDAIIRTNFYGPEPTPRLAATAFQVPRDDPPPPPVPIDVPPIEPLAPGAGPAAVPFGRGEAFNPPPDTVPVIPWPPIVPVVPVPGPRRPGRTPGDGFPSLPGENMTDVGPDRQEPFQNRGSADIVTQVEPRPYADIDVGVEEAPTGRLLLAVGVNSYAGLSGSLIYHERNFDIWNFPRSLSELFSGQAFRGGGQELRIEASPGTLINRVVASFRDPYLFDLPIGLGISGYAFGRQYPDYLEKRGGGRFSLGRQFGTNIYADIAMRVEEVNLGGFRFPTPAQFLAAEGNTFLATLRESIRYDNRNDPFVPSKGQYVELAYEQGWGTFTFPKFTAEGRTHFTVWQRPDQTGKQVFTLRGFFGITGRDTPTYEAFYAGDFRSMRGFAYRGVGPRVFGQNVGGIFTVVGSAEYQFPLTASDRLAAVVFSDFGSVESDYAINDFRVAIGAGLRVQIPQLGPLPLAFDFAYPLNKVDGTNGDRTRLFTFFIGAFW